MRTNTKKSTVNPVAQQSQFTPQQFQEEMEYIRGMYERLAVAKERINHLMVVGSVQNTAQLRNLYS